MSKRGLIAVAVALYVASPACRAVDLTSTDIIVQPQPTPGETPLGMAFVAGRCKLVLSMRGNPEAQATLDGLAQGLLGPVVEAIAAHELRHCWRHVQQHWGTLPAAVMDVSGLGQLSIGQADLLRDMWRTRREEGYADLVGLAWTLRHHPDQYAEVHAWHVRLRADQALGACRAWGRARAGESFGAGLGAGEACGQATQRVGNDARR